MMETDGGDGGEKSLTDRRFTACSALVSSHFIFYYRGGLVPRVIYFKNLEFYVTTLLSQTFFPNPALQKCNLSILPLLSETPATR